ncbi:hypothetical protein WJX75_008540 [Coccomyxa subellipsoidea]|uniref:Uncharacterized protein n=1 Tax=Coccomyxa subellipsoidea TaxID=248742 RepID=A0ABR2YN67_9CHLO
MPKSFDLTFGMGIEIPTLPDTRLPDSPHTGALNRQGVAWASQTEPLSSEPVDEQFSYSTQDYSNFDTPRDSAQHSTVPLDNEPSPEAAAHAQVLAPPHPSRAQVARSAVERLAQATPDGSGSQDPAAHPKSPVELLSALETAAR